MFTISAKGVYGLTAMMELGLKFEQGAVQIKDIAEAHGIPQHYLEQILVMLKKGGLVESYRGAQGGYALARRPDAIGVADILTILDGKLEIVPPERREGMLSFYWDRLESSVRAAVTLTLEDLILEKQQNDRRFVYTI